MSKVSQFYEKYPEDHRLDGSPSLKIEFLMTKEAIDPHLEKGDRILELGAGGGAYSLHYAKRGFDVTATDIAQGHVELINKKAKEKGLSIKTRRIDAVDLSAFEDGTFDVVLSLGPIYHLIKEKDRHKTISESCRVLKPGGLLVVAYINKLFILNAVMTSKKKYLNKDFVDQIIDESHIRSGQKHNFWTDAYFTKPSDILSFLKTFPLTITDHVAVDGLTPLFSEKIDQMDKAAFNAWLYQLRRTRRDKDSLGLSKHGLILAKKK